MCVSVCVHDGGRDFSWIFRFASYPLCQCFRVTFLLLTIHFPFLQLSLETSQQAVSDVTEGWTRRGHCGQRALSSMMVLVITVIQSVYRMHLTVTKREGSSAILQNKTNIMSYEMLTQA